MSMGYLDGVSGLTLSNPIIEVFEVEVYSSALSYYRQTSGPYKLPNAPDLPPKKWSRLYVIILDSKKGVSYEQKTLYIGGNYRQVA